MGVGCSKAGKEFDGKESAEEIIFERVISQHNWKSICRNSPPSLLELCLQTLCERPSLIGTFTSALSKHTD